MQRLVAGIDAGGTTVRIRCVDADTGEPAFEATCAAHSAGEPPFDLGFVFPPSEVIAVCAGVTKYTRPGVVIAWETMLCDRFAQAVVRVVPDYEVAFHAAVPDSDGVCVIAGTGSVAYGENATTGESVRGGGRGWEWGDEGSGAWLTTEMVRRTLRALDGQAPPTELTRTVCAELCTRDAAILAQTARQMTTEITRGFLMPCLSRLYEGGDAEARGLFVGAGGWLASLGAATARRLHFSATAPVTFGATGGVWNAGGETVRQAFDSALRRSFPEARSVFDAPAPVMGAVRLAQAATNRSETR